MIIVERPFRLLLLKDKEQEHCEEIIFRVVYTLPHFYLLSSSRDGHKYEFYSDILNWIFISVKLNLNSVCIWLLTNKHWEWMSSRNAMYLLCYKYILKMLHIFISTYPEMYLITWIYVLILCLFMWFHYYNQILLNTICNILN